MKEAAYKVGDKVRVINYGHVVRGSETDVESSFPLVGRSGAVTLVDYRPDLIGQQGVIKEVSMGQGGPCYAIDGISGKSAWYYESQLEAVADLSVVSESDFQEMFECLRDLIDLQNGCPLPTYKDEYNKTIERCEKILSKYEEQHSR